MSGVVRRIVKPAYNSSVEWLIADVTDVSTLHQLSVLHALVIVRLTLRYTTPDIRCRDRLYECDGGIIPNNNHPLYNGSYLVLTGRYDRLLVKRR